MVAVNLLSSSDTSSSGSKKRKQHLLFCKDMPTITDTPLIRLFGEMCKCYLFVKKTFKGIPAFLSNVLMSRTK